MDSLTFHGVVCVSVVAGTLYSNMFPEESSLIISLERGVCRKERLGGSLDRLCRPLTFVTSIRYGKPRSRVASMSL